MRVRKKLDLNGEGGKKEQGEIDGGEIIVRIYFKKNAFIYGTNIYALIKYFQGISS
jgi:hypothetical protein